MPPPRRDHASWQYVQKLDAAAVISKFLTYLVLTTVAQKKQSGLWQCLQASHSRPFPKLGSAMGTWTFAAPAQRWSSAHLSPESGGGASKPLQPRFPGEHGPETILTVLVLPDHVLATDCLLRNQLDGGCLGGGTSHLEGEGLIVGWIEGLLLHLRLQLFLLVRE